MGHRPGRDRQYAVFINRGIGMEMRRSWGSVEKCPHCPETNILRMSRTQKTCGKISCRSKEEKAARKRLAESKRLTREAHADLS